MDLPVAIAEQVLRSRFGEPAKPPSQYVIGFRTPSGRLLALHRTVLETTIWFQPPAPPTLDGIQLIPYAKNSNLNGQLSPLSTESTLRIKVDSQAALDRFLSWYAGPSSSVAPTDVRPGALAFRDALARFERLIVAHDGGREFSGFDEGIVGAWENYKVRLHQHALDILGADKWAESQIGSGLILRSMIAAIEIQDSRVNLTNNLVFWQNRFGHANRDHHVLLEAETNPKLRRDLERLLFDLYCGGADEGTAFDGLSAKTGDKYALMAYLYFLKDMDRFMPIQPSTYDRAFRELGVGLVTLRNCTWGNYQHYNAALSAVKNALAQGLDPLPVRLIDAHSFCWMLVRLEQEPGGIETASTSNAGRILGARERSIVRMRMSVEGTALGSNGQTVLQTIKNKDLYMTPGQLETRIKEMLDLQQNRCALTGIPFEFDHPGADKGLLPSVDRIDSNGHYGDGNLQIVCRFVNFWKGSSDNAEFKRFLMLVRGTAAE